MTYSQNESCESNIYFLQYLHLFADFWEVKMTEHWSPKRAQISESQILLTAVNIISNFNIVDIF